MQNDIAIRVENISKKYQIGQKPQKLFSFSHKNHDLKDFYALKNINFEIKKGDAVGLIGRNGSGKSTLLKILGGITYPTTGNVQLNGSYSIVMESGIGFHKDLTGYDNIFSYGQIIGMNKNFIKEKLDEIVDFAEIGDFLYSPVKHYSSGMLSRLSFAIVTFLSNDILIFDEVLSFGDIGFHHRALRKIKEINESGRTIIFVSHKLNDIVNISNKAMVLRYGELIAEGLPADIISDYIEDIMLTKTSNKLSNADKFSKNEVIFLSGHFPGPDAMKLKKLAFTNLNKENKILNNSHSQIDITFELENYKAGNNWDFGLIIRDVTDNIIFSSTFKDNLNHEHLETGEIKLSCSIPSHIFNIGTFFIFPFFINPDSREFIRINDFIAFNIISEDITKFGFNRFFGPMKFNLEWKNNK